MTASRPPKIGGKHSGRARRGAIKVDEGQRSVGVNNRSGDRQATKLRQSSHPPAPISASVFLITAHWSFAVGAAHRPQKICAPACTHRGAGLFDRAARLQHRQTGKKTARGGFGAVGCSPGWLRPAIAVLAKPSGHFGVELAELAGRNTDPDADGEAPFGRDDHFARACGCGHCWRTARVRPCGA